MNQIYLSHWMAEKNIKNLKQLEEKLREQNTPINYETLRSVKHNTGGRRMKTLDKIAAVLGIETKDLFRKPKDDLKEVS